MLYQVLARDSVIKIDATMFHSVGFHLLYAEEEETRPVTTQANNSDVS